MADEALLLRQAARGDRAAFALLLERHGGYLYGVAHAMTRNATDAEDVVQETLIAALSGNFRGESSLRTWLVKILVRQAAMSRRSTRRREQRVRLAGDDAMGTGGSSTEAVARSAVPAVEARLDLADMLETLTHDQRAVIVLRELQGLSYDEMADALGVPVGTVESRLHRAREELRRRYGRES